MGYLSGLRLLSSIIAVRTRLAPRLGLILLLALSSVSGPIWAADRCSPILSQALTDLSLPSARIPASVDLFAPLRQTGSAAIRADLPVEEAIDLQRLINPEDWRDAPLFLPPGQPAWLRYGETTAEDWMNTARWIASGADGRPIDLELLQEIHRRAMRNHFFVGAENRRIIANAKVRGIPKEEFLRDTRSVMHQKKTVLGLDHSQFRGTLRSTSVDDLPHDGSLQLPGNQRAFSREEYEAMKKNPYMIPDPDHPPVFSQDGTTVRARFRYMPPQRVEAASREILARLNLELRSAKTNEDIILAVVRMNQAMLAAHPFQDGNGRSIRLLSDLVFQRHGLPPPLYPNERDLEMTDTEAVQFILKGMNDYLRAKSAAP